MKSLVPSEPSDSNGNNGYRYLLEKVNAVERELAIIKETLKHVPIKDDLAKEVSSAVDKALKNVSTKDDLTREISQAVKEVRNEVNKQWLTWMSIAIGVITMFAAVIAATSALM